MSKWITLCDINCETNEEAIQRVQNLIKLGFLKDFKEKYEFRLLSPQKEIIFTA